MSRSIPIRNTSIAHHYFASAEEALACAERYFEALTSETEELALKCYAASDEAAADARFDELRAVMGLAAMGRRLANKTDPQQVLQAMQQSIDQMEQADKVPSVENQLNDMFQQLPPEQVK